MRRESLQRARRWLVVAALTVTVAAVWSDVASAQCVMCRSALDSPEGRLMIAAFRSGILFLLAVPFATFGVVAFLAVRHRRRTSTTPADPSAIS